MVSSQVTFGVLGPLEVRRDGGERSVPSLRQRAVLAALLVHAGHPVSGGALIAAAWDGDLPANPRSALHTVLSRLRGLLGVDAIRAEPAGYRLVVEPQAVDAARFEALRRAARDTPNQRARRLLEQALALWRGPAYAEFAQRPFATAEAVRLDELRLACVEDLAEIQVEDGDPVAALPALAALVAEHPLRERARSLLMTARYQAGQISEALDTYRDYRTVLADELGLDPSPRLRDLHQRILSHELPAPPARPAVRAAGGGPWPVTETAFVGRDDETAELARLVVVHRLVTVTGPGGVGKTRLVAETLPTLAGRLELPVTMVELAGVDGDRVDTAIATGLGIGPAPGNTREAVLDYMSVLPAILVLDNCEHVLDRVRWFAQAALRRCPGLRVVATSRHRINLPAEQVLPLAPLTTPDAGTADAALTAAVRLFADRARRVRPDFTLTDAVVPAVAELCRRLDGLPLAIELAATRAATLGVEPLRTRLDRSLDLLGGAGGDRSLRATLDWSYRLLDDADRRLLAAFAVFEGEFDLESAERVVPDRDGRPVAVGLARLVDASLVMAWQAAGAARYRLLQTVRAFARERLAGSGAEPEVRAAHARWIRRVAQDAAGVGHEPAAPSAELAMIAANAPAAVGWALRAGAAELAGDLAAALMRMSSARWYLRRDLIDVARQVAQDPLVQRSPAAARAAAAGAFAATQVGDLASGERAARAALRSATEAGDRDLALVALGIVTLYRGDHESSRRAWQELLAVPGLPPVRQVNGHASLALIACYDGSLPAARRHADRATAVAEAAGTAAGLAFARYVAGEVTAGADLAAAVPLLAAAARDADRAGVGFTAGLADTARLAALTRLDRTEEALDLLAPLLERWLRLAAWPQLWTTLRTLAELLARNHRPEPAALLLAAADRAPSAPAVAGTHAGRYARLAGTLQREISPPAYEKITVLAGLLPRAAVVDRARAALDDLRGRAGERTPEVARAPQ